MVLRLEMIMDNSLYILAEALGDSRHGDEHGARDQQTAAAAGQDDPAGGSHLSVTLLGLEPHHSL